MSNFREMMKSPIISQIEPEIIRVLLMEDNPGDARFVKEILKWVSYQKRLERLWLKI
jgi:hypothetical protein